MSYVEFTEEMKSTYTLLAPNMLPTHFALFARIFNNEGYQIELLNNDGPNVISNGLRYVHNDTCYPALLIIGQFIDALKSGEYNTDRVALLLTQTGGGCRASNYIFLLRKAITAAGFGHVPVLALSANNMEKHRGFRLTVSMMRKAIAAVAYGDLMMQAANQVRPYETLTGSTDAMCAQWVNELAAQFAGSKGMRYQELAINLNTMAASFAAIKIARSPKVKVGIVGEIYVKFAPLGNNHLEAFLQTQGCEIMVPGLMGFLMYSFTSGTYDVKLYGGNRAKTFAVERFIDYFRKIERAIAVACTNNGFIAPASITHLQELAKPIISRGVHMGEGYLLTAEMAELIENGYPNIICAQPFGCLPNHIVGKGMAGKLKELYPMANIVTIDYDPGATRVNQENRIKLMLAVAGENF